MTTYGRWSPVETGHNGSISAGQGPTRVLVRYHANN